MGERQLPGGGDSGSVSSSSGCGPYDNIGFRHLDSGSEDSDIDILPIVDRPSNRYEYESSDESSGGEDPAGIAVDAEAVAKIIMVRGSDSVVITNSTAAVLEEDSRANTKNNQIIGLPQGHGSQCTAPGDRNNALVLLEVGLDDLTVSGSTCTGLHLQLPGARFTSTTTVRTGSTGTYNVHCTVSCGLFLIITVVIYW